MITKDNAAQWFPLVRAMAEGKTIQVRGDMGGWFDMVSGCLTDLRDGVARYRIKPEPKLRPWKAEEAPKVFVVVSRDGRMCVATTNGATVVVVGHLFHYVYDLESMRDHWTRVNSDGSHSPCGVLCEGEEHGEA